MFHDFPDDFPMFFHDFPWNAEHIYTNLCLGALSSFSSSPSRETFLLAGARFGAQFAPHKDVDCAATTATTATRFNKHGEFTEVHSCFKLGAEQTNFNNLSWCVNELILKDKSTTKNWPIPKGPKWSIYPCGMTFWDEAVQPNPQSTRFKNVATMVIQVVDRNRGPIRAFSGNNGHLGHLCQCQVKRFAQKKSFNSATQVSAEYFVGNALVFHVVL